MNDFLTNYFKNPKDKEDFWIALVVIALFLGSIIYSIFPFGENVSPVSFFEESEENISTEFTTLVAQKEDKAITKKVLSDKPLVKKLDNWIDTVEADILPVDTTIIDNEVLEFVEDDVIEVETDNEASTTIIEDTIISETIESSIVIEGIPETATSDTTDDMATSEETIEKPSVATDIEPKPTETEQPKKVKPTPITPKKSKPRTALPKCVIIVGAFAKRHNADKVIKQLEKAKYVVHTFYRKGRLAVSVTHGCKDEKGLQTKLKALKKQYKDAWILR